MAARPQLRGLGYKNCEEGRFSSGWQGWVGGRARQGGRTGVAAGARPGHVQGAARMEECLGSPWGAGGGLACGLLQKVSSAADGREAYVLWKRVEGGRGAAPWLVAHQRSAAAVNSLLGFLVGADEGRRGGMRGGGRPSAHQDCGGSGSGHACRWKHASKKHHSRRQPCWKMDSMRCRCRRGGAGEAQARRWEGGSVGARRPGQTRRCPATASRRPAASSLKGWQGTRTRSQHAPPFIHACRLQRCGSQRHAPAACSRRTHLLAAQLRSHLVHHGRHIAGELLVLGPPKAVEEALVQRMRRACSAWMGAHSSVRRGRLA